MMLRNGTKTKTISTQLLHKNHVIGVCLSSQSAHENHNQEKKPTHLCAPREFLKKMCLPCLIITQSCYFHYRINTLRVLSLRVLRFVFSTYYVRKGSWTFYLEYPQINEVGKSDHVEVFKGVVSPIIPSAPKCFSRHFIFHRKYVFLE